MISLLASLVQDSVLSIATVALALSPGFYSGVQDNTVRAINDFQSIFNSLTSGGGLLRTTSSSTAPTTTQAGVTYFDFDDISAVYTERVAANASPTVANNAAYTRYQMVLDSGVVKYADWYDVAAYANNVQRFRDIGYTGPVEQILNYKAFRANPNMGEAPLSVQFTAQVATQYSGGVALNFGDGESAEICNATGACTALSHTYDVAGLYSPTLVATDATGATSTIGRTTVRATGSSTDATGDLSVSPSSGSAPLTVTATFDRGSLCESATLDWGDDVAQVDSASSEDCTQTGGEYERTHTYEENGTYTVTLTIGDRTETATVTVADDAQSGLVVSPSSGVAPLEVTATFDRPSSCTDYTIDWGDDVAQTATNLAESCTQEIVEDFELTHTYEESGTYTVTLTQGESTDADTATVSVEELVGGATLTATPATGTPPLDVTFDGSTSVAYEGGVTINFGDGTTGTFCAANSECAAVSLTHRYDTAGTYMVRLITGEGDDRSILVQTPVSVTSRATTDLSNIRKVVVTASPTSITAGQDVTISWTAPEPYSCIGFNGSSLAATGSKVVGPSKTTTYTITCTNTAVDMDVVSGEVTVTVQPVSGGMLQTIHDWWKSVFGNDSDTDTGTDSAPVTNVITNSGPNSGTGGTLLNIHNWWKSVFGEDADTDTDTGTGTNTSSGTSSGTGTGTNAGTNSSANSRTTGGTQTDDTTDAVGDRASSWWQRLYGGGSSSDTDQSSSGGVGDYASSLWKSIFSSGVEVEYDVIVDPSNIIDTTGATTNSQNTSSGSSNTSTNTQSSDPVGDRASMENNSSGAGTSAATSDYASFPNTSATTNTSSSGQTSGCVGDLCN